MGVFYLLHNMCIKKNRLAIFVVTKTILANYFKIYSIKFMLSLNVVSIFKYLKYNLSLQKLYYLKCLFLK